MILAGELVVGIDDMILRNDPDISREKLEKQRMELAEKVRVGVIELMDRNRERDRTQLTLSEQQEKLERELIIRQLLKQQIESKLIYHDARRTIPAEGCPQVEKKLAGRFDESKLPDLMKRYQVDSRRKLDEKLQSLGSSLERRRRAFVQSGLAQGWMMEQVNIDGEITYDQMVEYYRDHHEEFDNPARAQWQELMVRFSSHPNKQAAYAALANLGNQLQRGVPWEVAAKRASEGATAAEGGRRDWTTKGSLVSDTLDQALFGLPVGQFSPILGTVNGLHIIRVVQREEASRTPFLEAQTEIEPKIRNQRTQQQLRGYVFRLRQQIPVSTVFDRPAEQQGPAKQQGVAGAHNSMQR